MSGGAFDYRDCCMDEVADKIVREVRESGKIVDGWTRPTYTRETKARLMVSAAFIRLAGNLAHDVDWLLSGDTGEDTFTEDWSHHVGEAKCAIRSVLAAAYASKSSRSKGSGKKSKASSR
jgi:hypothetical protein